MKQYGQRQQRPNKRKIDVVIEKYNGIRPTTTTNTHTQKKNEQCDIQNPKWNFYSNSPLFPTVLSSFLHTKYVLNHRGKFK